MRRLAVCVCVLLVAGCAGTPEERLPSAVEPEVRIARAAPPEVADHLARAAACVERGDEPAAVPHLVAHLNARPEAVMIRAYLAELLLRTGKSADARREFEQFARQASGMSGEASRHLVHAHTRLMEIAAEDNDPFGEHLHRGIALVLMVRRWEGEPAADGGQLAEATLAKAGRELRQAERRKPTDPRANVYLAEVYGRLGQATAARTAAGRVTLPDASLTRSESEALRTWGGNEMTSTRPR
jgi:thioredoxin-like negative regulator of GroEL